MGHCLELRSFLRIGEDALTESLPIESPGGVEHARSERLHDLREPLATRQDDFAGEMVGFEDREAALTEPCDDAALSRGEAARQAEDMHRPNLPPRGKHRLAISCTSVQMASVLRTASRRSFGLLAGAFGLAVSAPSPAAEAGIRPHWSFHAGAPLSGPPGVGPDGTLVFGTVDGYVHALRDGFVLVATDKSRLYAIQPDGSLAWWKTIAGGVASELALDSRGRVWLRTGSGTAIAVSRRGGVVGFAKIGRAMTLGPVPLSSGPVIVASQAGELGVIGDFGKYRRISLETPITGLRALGPGFIALREKSLTRIDSELRSTWVRNDVDVLICSDPLVTLEKGAVRWLTKDGSVAESAVIGGTLREPSTCTSTSVFAVDERNELVQIRRGGSRGHVGAPAGPLLALDASRSGALVASYRDGRVVSLKVTP